MSTSSRFPSSTYWPTAAKRYTTDGPANRPSRKRPHPQIPDVSCEYAPHQYLMDNGLPVNRHPEHHRLSVTTAPIPDRPYQFDGSPTPSTPATALTDASTVPSEMVSLNGNFDSSYNDLSHKLGMFRVISNASNFSFSEDNSKASVDFPAEFDDNCLTAFAPSQQSDLITHGLALSPTSAINLSYESNSAYSSQFPTSTDATAMQKSPSSAGSESDSSTKSRTYRVRHQEHIRQAEKCKIASKADLSKDSVRMVRVESLDGSIQVKASIPRKAQSPRTQGPRQYCKYCQDHPEGFRGEHELQRHTSRAHPVTTRKFWICEDLHGDGTFLAKCKSCVQKKRYNADYNAAAQYVISSLRANMASLWPFLAKMLTVIVSVSDERTSSRAREVESLRAKLRSVEAREAAKTPPLSSSRRTGYVKLMRPSPPARRPWMTATTT